MSLPASAMGPRGAFLAALLWVPMLDAQETDLVDTRDLAGRGVAFVTEDTTNFGILHVSAVGDVNGDGVPDIGLFRRITQPTVDGLVYIIFGSSHWKGSSVIAPELSGSIHFAFLDLQATGVGSADIINVGDLNGDGYSEFAFTLDGYGPLDLDPEVSGVMFIVHGRPTFTSGEVIEAIGSDIPGTRIYSTDSSIKQTGYNGTCAVLDINGDGLLDLAVGAKLDLEAGGVFMFFSRPGTSDPNSI